MTDENMKRGNRGAQRQGDPVPDQRDIKGADQTQSMLWVITLTYSEADSAATLLRYATRLTPTGSVAASPGIGFTVTMHLEGADIVDIVHQARALAARVVSSDPLGLMVAPSPPRGTCGPDGRPCSAGDVVVVRGLR